VSTHNQNTVAGVSRVIIVALSDAILKKVPVEVSLHHNQCLPLLTILTMDK